MSLIDFLLTESVTIKPFSHYGSGEFVHGESETRKARVEYNPGLRTTYPGSSEIDAVPAKARIFMTGEEIPQRSLITYNGTEYTVTECKVLKGFVGDHLEVLVV